MKKIRIASVGIVSFASMSAIFYAFFGVFYGFIFLIISAAAKSIPGGVEGFNFPQAIGALSIIILPIIFAIMGFIGGVIIAVFINITLKIIKGLELEITED